MELTHPILGRPVASYRYSLGRTDSWWAAAPLGLLAGVVLTALQPDATTARLVITWAAVAAAAAFWIFYAIRERWLKRPLEVFENGLIWADGDSHVEVLFHEINDIQLAHRRHISKPWAQETWWIIEANDGTAFALGPTLRDHREAARWIALRAADTDVAAPRALVPP